MRQGFPPVRAGMCIGLLGGSFDPAHSGHVLISREALKRFGLDEVWWLVSPGNPLKTKGPAPLAERLSHARNVMRHPRVRVTDLEARFGTRHTFATLTRLIHAYPGVRFVWLMGADNLATFHLWENWQAILELVPVGVMARPGQRISARLSPAARQYRRFRLRGREANLLCRSESPRWCFLNVPMSDLSSTQLRRDGLWSSG